ncbi:unnamed protein product [Lepidochelys kempii]
MAPEECWPWGQCGGGCPVGQVGGSSVGGGSHGAGREGVSHGPGGRIPHGVFGRVSPMGQAGGGGENPPQGVWGCLSWGRGGESPVGCVGVSPVGQAGGGRGESPAGCVGVSLMGQGGRIPHRGCGGVSRGAGGGGCLPGTAPHVQGLGYGCGKISLQIPAASPSRWVCSLGTGEGLGVPARGRGTSRTPGAAPAAACS